MACEAALATRSAKRSSAAAAAAGGLVSHMACRLCKLRITHCRSRMRAALRSVSLLPRCCPLSARSLTRRCMAQQDQNKRQKTGEGMEAKTRCRWGCGVVNLRGGAAWLGRPAGSLRGPVQADAIRTTACAAPRRCRRHHCRRHCRRHCRSYSLPVAYCALIAGEAMALKIGTHSGSFQ